MYGMESHLPLDLYSPTTASKTIFKGTVSRDRIQIFWQKWILPRSLNGLLTILKNTSELGQWTKRSQQFTYTVNQKEITKTAKKFSRYMYNNCYFPNTRFSPKPRKNGSDDTLSEEHFENSVTRRGTYSLYTTRTVHLCPNIWILFLVTQSFKQRRIVVHSPESILQTLWKKLTPTLKKIILLRRPLWGN